MTTIRKNDARSAPTTTTTTTTTATATTATTATNTPVTTSDAGVESMPTTTTTAATTAKQLPASELARLKNAIDTATSKGSRDGTDGAALLGNLARLPAADFRAVMSDPTRAAKIFSTLDGDDRALLLDLMVKKGAVAVQPGTTTTTSPYAPVPPRAPALLRDEASAQPAVRRAILDENVARVAAYQAEYATYRDAYHHAVEHARDVGGLRDLGPIAPSSLPANMPGAALSSDANRAYLDARGRNDDDRATTQMVADRFRRLSGREVAGLSFSGEVELSVVVGEHDRDHTTVGGKLEGTIGPDGETKADAHGALGYFSNQHSGVVVDTHGAAVKVGEVGVGAHLSDEALTLNGMYGPVTGSAGFGGDRMSFGLGVETHKTIFDTTFNVGVGAKVGLQGVTAEDRAMFVSTSEVGFFDTPPELTRGKAWASLPEATRTDYERQGWTAAEWTKKADLARFARRAA